MTLLTNKGDILPLGNLDKTSVAVVSIGAPADNEFSELCSRYARVERFGVSEQQRMTAATGAKIRKHDVVLMAVFSDKPWAREAASMLRGASGLVEVFFINPYRMARFDASVRSASAVLMAYDDTPLTREYAAQAVFGGINVDGKLPVAVKGLYKQGAGLSLKKTRLGYTVPEAKGLRASLADSIDSIVGVGLRTGAFPGCQVLVARRGAQPQLWPHHGRRSGGVGFHGLRPCVGVQSSRHTSGSHESLRHGTVPSFRQSVETHTRTSRYGKGGCHRAAAAVSRIGHTPVACSA